MPYRRRSWPVALSIALGLLALSWGPSIAALGAQTRDATLPVTPSPTVSPTPHRPTAGTTASAIDPSDGRVRYRVRNTPGGPLVESSTDRGQQWRVVLSPTRARTIKVSGATTRLPGRDDQGCLPANYQLINTLTPGPAGTTEVYIGTGGTPGNYLDRGCDSATGGLFWAHPGAAATFLGPDGLPFDQDPVGRGPRSYAIDRITVDTQDHAVLYVHALGTGPASTPEGLYKSFDGGLHWQEIDKGLQPSTTVTNTVGLRVPIYNAGILSVNASHSTQLTFTNDTGTYMSTDGGLYWQPMGAGLPATKVTTRILQPPVPAGTVGAARTFRLAAASGAHLVAAVRGPEGKIATLTTLPPNWTWSKLTPAGTPPPGRQDFAAAWDATDHQMLLFGGTNTGATVAMADTWAYTPGTNTWTARAPRPGGAFGVSGVWDADQSVFLTFGGRTGASAATALGDVWAYKPTTNSWTQLWASGAPGGPAPRSNAVVTWDTTDHHLLVYGGLSVENAVTSTVTNDLWAFSPAADLSGGIWSRLEDTNASCTVTCPQPRYSAEGAWDPSTGTLRLFGGRNSAKSVLSDTWVWAAAAGWTQENRLRQPGGRTEGAVAYTNSYGAVVIGPGLSLASGNEADSWVDQASQHSWQILASGEVSPPVRRLTQWVANDNDGSLLLFGGRLSGVGAANDLWQLAPTSDALATPTAVATVLAGKGLDENRAVADDKSIIVGPTQIAATQQLGGRYVRVDFRLGLAADWTDPALLSAYDTVVDTYRAAGIDVLGLVTAEATHDITQTDWTANNQENNPGQDGDNSFLRDTYINGALKPLLVHFHDRVKTWELWNEPNSYAQCPTSTTCTGGSYMYPSNFAALLVDAYTAIKDPAPNGLGFADVTLISGGVLGHSNGGSLTATNAGADYLAATVTQGMTTTATWQAFMSGHGHHYPLDAVGQHIYIDQSLLTSSTDLGAYYDWVHNAAAPGTVPTYLTEGAWNTSPGGVPGATQADNLNILFETTRQMGFVAQVTWFQLQDLHAANLYFGLLDTNGQPKPAFSAYAAQPAAPAMPTDTATPLLATAIPTQTPSPTPSETTTPSASATPTLTSSPIQPATATPSADQTTITVTLRSGWNLIELPITPTVPLEAQDLLTTVLTNDNGSLAELASWAGRSWTVALAGDTHSGNFPVQPGNGYFLFSDRNSSLSVNGRLPIEAPVLTLNTGWNLIGLPLATDAQTAQDLLNSLSAANLNPLEVAGWTGTRWETLVETGIGSSITSGSNFALNRTSGYFVYVRTGGAWRAQAH